VIVEWVQASRGGAFGFVEVHVPIDVQFSIPIEPLSKFIKATDFDVRAFIIPVVGTGQRCVEDFPDDFNIFRGQLVREFSRILERARLCWRAIDEAYFIWFSSLCITSLQVCAHRSWSGRA